MKNPKSQIPNPKIIHLFRILNLGFIKEHCFGFRYSDLGFKLYTSLKNSTL